MSQPILHVIASFQAAPGKADELKALLSNLIHTTVKEDGCIKYELLQEDGESSRLTFVEEWRDENALDAHLSAPHLKNAMKMFPELTEGKISITKYYAVTEAHS